MIKRRFYKLEHGDRDAPSESSSSSSDSEAEAEGMEDEEEDYDEEDEEQEIHSEEECDYDHKDNEAVTEMGEKNASVSSSSGIYFLLIIEWFYLSTLHSLFLFIW